MTTTTEAASATQPPAPEAPSALAVSYLRVSTREHAERGGNEEGFSIPAQREANPRKADDLGACVIREFVDAGESARSADRGGLQDMLAFITATPVQFCIVHKLGRLARTAPTTSTSTKHSSPPESPWCPRPRPSIRPRPGC